MSDDLVRWAEQIERETFEYWQENHDDWEYGVRVFYGSVDPEAEILILGYQPGGDESKFESDREQFEQGNFSPPDRHQYLEYDYPLAREMRAILGEEAIANSIKTNVNFFRAPDTQTWEQGLSQDRRNAIEQFCHQRVAEMVEKLSPSLIVAEGTATTWDTLKDILGIESDSCKYRQEGPAHRLVCTSRNQDYSAVGLMHPSGNRISDSDRQLMKNKVRSIVTKETQLDITSTES